jgi:2-succinyl-6-hydroxy-2,4-cyclohexadiene-1-carboxylate synthase
VAPATIVLLHGFAGTRRSWDLVVELLDRERYTPLALDLRGHGSAASARPVTLDAVVDDILAASPPRFVLAGYSMGGRVALHVALRAPTRVSRLVLLATTAGLEDPHERAQRAAADSALAARIERGAIEDFAREWMGQSLFAGTPAHAAAAWREDLQRNAPHDIAAALRGLSAGVLPPVWDRLGELAMPSLAVAGERDAKYVALARRLAAALPRGELLLVPNAGHGLPREAPAAVAAALHGDAAPTA